MHTAKAVLRIAKMSALPRSLQVKVRSVSK